MVIQLVKVYQFFGTCRKLKKTFQFFRECCILELMNKNQPKLLPLYLICIGSLLLAFPGIYGGFFLFIFAAEAATKPFQSTSEWGFIGILFPLPVVIGFLLLGGYIWTIVKKRFIKWFWIISAIFNLLITLVSFGLLFKFAYENLMNSESPNIFALLFFLFPLWTAFVTVASFKYSSYKSTNKNIHLP